MKGILSLMLALLLLAGCAADSAAPAPAPPSPPPPMESLKGTPMLPDPPDAPRLVRADGQVKVSAIQLGRKPYLWAPDGSRVAFQDAGGLWTISPDGSAVERVAVGPAYRELVGWAEEGILWLEARPDGLAVVVGRSGQEPRVVTLLNESQVGRPGLPLWRHLSGSRLVLAAEGQPVWQVDLPTGRTQVLTQSALPVHYGELAVSPGGDLAAFKLSNRDDPVRLLDLHSGAVQTPEPNGSHLTGVTWSPDGRWAVRAADPGSGLPVPVGANVVEGGTHLVVGNARGALRSLRPPRPLQLVAGPVWSPDGSRLAVTAGAVDASGLHGASVWLVEPESGQWQPLGDLQGGWVAGWWPDGSHLIVRMGARTERWPVEGGAGRAEPLAGAFAAGEALPGGGLVYLDLEPAARIVLLRGAGEPVTLLEGAGHLSDLTFRAGYAGAVARPDGGAPTLVLLRIP